jgi:signal peptidase II
MDMNDTTLSWKESGHRWLWITALVIVLDQLTKLWVVATIPFKQLIYVLPVLDITYTVNTGAAWSMFANMGGAQRWILSALAIAVSIALVIWLRRLRFSTHTLLVGGLVLILGGAIGNVIDRLRLGHVIDFVHAHWNEASFPAFNVADAAISIGAVCVIIDALFEGRRNRLAAQAQQAQAQPRAQDQG